MERLICSTTVARGISSRSDTGHKIIRPAAGQSARDAVPLKVLQYPWVFCIGQVINNDVNDFVLEPAKPGAVFLIMQRFGLVGMGFGRLHQDEFVHNLRQFVQPQFKQLQFVKKGEAIVNHGHGAGFSFEAFACGQAYAPALIMASGKQSTVDPFRRVLRAILAGSKSTLHQVQLF